MGEQRGKKDDWDERAILVEPVAAIKGTLPEGRLALAGKSLAEGEAARYGVLSNPYELEAAHPASYIGGCIRYLFPPNTTALFFLERDEDGKSWRAAGGPFSRWAEDVLSDDAPWLRLVRLYARAATMPEAERNTLLEAERARLARERGDIVAQLMAADIARQMAGPNERWNTIMRRAVKGDGDIPEGADPEAAADALAELVDRASAAEPRANPESVPCDTGAEDSVCAEAAIAIPDR